MLYKIGKEQYDELLRISNNNESTLLQFYSNVNDVDIEINGIECNDNRLLSDFIAEFYEFMYDHTLLIINEINILNRNGFLYFELEIKTDWAQSIHWDGTKLNNETEKIIQSVLEDKLKRKISTESIDYWIELKGCKKSVIECTGLTISLFDDGIKEFLEFNLEDQDKALICNKINDLFSLELPSHEEEYLLSIFDNHIDSFIVYLPNKVNVELMIKDYPDYSGQTVPPITE